MIAQSTVVSKSSIDSVSHETLIQQHGGAKMRDLIRLGSPVLMIIIAEGGLFSFGYVRVERRGDGRAWLIAEARGEAGEVRPGSRVELAGE